MCNWLSKKTETALRYNGLLYSHAFFRDASTAKIRSQIHEISVM